MFRFCRILTAAICAACLLSVVSEQPAQAAVPNVWTGEFDGFRWNREGNWFAAQVPNATHDVLFDIASDTLMDIPSNWELWDLGPRDIATYTVDPLSAGVMRMGAFDSQNPSDLTLLNIFGNFSAVAANYTVLIGPRDGLLVGNPIPGRWIAEPPIPPVLNSIVSSVDFDLDGELFHPAALAVTGELDNSGGVAEHAWIRIGFETPRIDTDPAFPIVGAPGRIRGLLSAWTLNGDVQLLAKECVDLGHWQMNAVEETPRLRCL